MNPFWLHALAIIALLRRGLRAPAARRRRRHPQHMWIMDVVWPVTGLYAGPLALWGYYTFGRAPGTASTSGQEKPFFAAVGIGATHCGAGCTLGDILAEWLCFGVPAVAVWFGWQSVFAEKMFAVWIVDFIFAFAFGIVFQYFTIAPMRGLAFGTASLPP